MLFHRKIKAFKPHLFPLISSLELRRTLNPMFIVSEHYFCIPSATSILINSLGLVFVVLVGRLFTVFVKFAPTASRPLLPFCIWVFLKTRETKKPPSIETKRLDFQWCPRPDSNRHVLIRQWILSPPRLPFHHTGATLIIK